MLKKSLLVALCLSMVVVASQEAFADRIAVRYNPKDMGKITSDTTREQMAAAHKAYISHKVTFRLDFTADPKKGILPYKEFRNLPYNDVAGCYILDSDLTSAELGAILKMSITDDDTTTDLSGQINRLKNPPNMLRVIAR